MVKGLVDELGVRHEEVRVMNVMVNEYFANLITSEVHEVDQNVLRDVNRRVTADMNHLLLAPFSREEVDQQSSF